MVLSRDSFTSFCVYQFSEQGNVLSRHDISSFALSQHYDSSFGLPLDNDLSFLFWQLDRLHNCRFRLLHKTEQSVELNFSKENLLLHNKDGRVVREIKLKLSALNDLAANEPEFTVTTQGLVVMLTIEKGTGKRMIAIL